MFLPGPRMIAAPESRGCLASPQRRQVESHRYAPLHIYRADVSFTTTEDVTQIVRLVRLPASRGAGSKIRWNFQPTLKVPRRLLAMHFHFQRSPRRLLACYQ